MGFWRNLSKLIDLTLTHGSGNVLILLKSEYDSKIQHLERNLSNVETNSDLRISDLENELSETKQKLWDTEFLVENADSKVKPYLSKIESLEIYIASFESDFERLKKIEQLAKSLEKDFTQTLLDKKNLQTKIEDLEKELNRLKQIESLARNIEPDMVSIKSKLQVKENEILKKNTEIISLNKQIQDAIKMLQDEKAKHVQELKRVAAEEREKAMKQVSDAVIESVVPIIKSDKNPIPDRVFFDEVNESKQRLYIKEERLEANNKLSEIQVRQAQHEARQAQHETRVERGLMQIREEKMLVDFRRIQNELMSYELTMKVLHTKINKWSLQGMNWPCKPICLKCRKTL